MPWSIDGEKWHRGQKGFRPGRRIRWDRDILGRMLRCLELATPKGRWDWSSRDSAKRRLPGSGLAWARLMTKLNRGLELHLVGPKGRFNLAAIDRFGADHQLRTNVERFDAIRLSFLTDDDWSDAPFIDFLTEHAEAFRKEFCRGDR